MKEEVYFFAVFAVFNAYMISTVEGLIAKLFFAAWFTYILTGAAYFYVEERKSELKKRKRVT